MQESMLRNSNSAPVRINPPYYLTMLFSHSIIVDKSITSDGFYLVGCIMILLEMEAIFSNSGDIVDRILARVSSAMNAEKVNANVEKEFRMDLDHIDTLFIASDEKRKFIAQIAAVLEEDYSIYHHDYYYHALHGPKLLTLFSKAKKQLTAYFKGKNTEPQTWKWNPMNWFSRRHRRVAENDDEESTSEKH